MTFAATFECLLVWHNERKRKKKNKKKLRTPNCDHTTTITTSTTIQILQGLFCICECRLSATFVRHGIVSISLYFKSWERQITSFIFKIKGGYFFQLTQIVLTKARQLKNKSTFYLVTVCSEIVVQRNTKKKLIPKFTNYFLNQSTFEWLWNHMWL